MVIGTVKLFLFRDTLLPAPVVSQGGEQEEYKHWTGKNWGLSNQFSSIYILNRVSRLSSLSILFGTSEWTGDIFPT
ncbi:MAG: hypothetical protein ACFFD4_37920 [Candidatus Odinarchaeota archaeon]